MREKMFHNVMLVVKKDNEPELIRSRAETFEELMAKVNERINSTPCKVVQMFTSEDEEVFFNTHLEYLLAEKEMWVDYFQAKMSAVEKGSYEYNSFEKGMSTNTYDIENEVADMVRYRDFDKRVTSEKVLKFVNYFNENCVRGCEIEL